jgi:hypothetical protein
LFDHLGTDVIYIRLPMSLRIGSTLGWVALAIGPILNVTSPWEELGLGVWGLASVANSAGIPRLLPGLAYGKDGRSI